MPITDVTRDFSRTHYALELDGFFGGWLSSADGGNATAMVVVDQTSSDTAGHKHLAGVRYEDITIKCGTGMSKNVFDWFNEASASKFLPKNGAVIEVETNNKTVSRLDFINGVIVGVELPALDTTSKDAVVFTIRISPESTRLRRSRAEEPTLHNAIVQKISSKSNFRLEIPGLDCSKINEIDPIRMRRVATSTGDLSRGTRGPAFMDVSNLAVTLAESSAGSFYDWHEDFVIKGNHGRDKDRSGALYLLAPNLTEILFNFPLKHLGIFKINSERGRR
jgi:hypothetical protein